MSTTIKKIKIVRYIVLVQKQLLLIISTPLLLMHLIYQYLKDTDFLVHLYYF